MKIKCPICNIEGLLQQRGNSYRVQHYQGFENGKRSYLYHKLSKMEVNGSKNVGVKEADLSAKRENLGAEGGIRTHELLRDRLLKPTPLTWLGDLCAETPFL
jgi:hypothetical protein